MKLLAHVAIFLALMLAGTPVWAAQAPFSWPNSFSVTIREVNKVTGKFTVDMYSRDGLKVRNQIAKPNAESEVKIYRMDEFKAISVATDGTVTESKIAPEWQIPPIFPTGGTWEASGSDTLHGEAAAKYKVTDESLRSDASKPVPSFTVWLSADHKYPLRVEDGDRVLEFYNYTAGAQAPALFEAPAAHK